MSRVAPEFSHRRLQNVKFLSDADLELYADLRTQVQALQDPGEKIEIPEPNGAGAWQTLYATYRALKRRSEVDRDPAGTQQAANNSLVEEEWNRFAVQRVTFLEWLQREPVDQDTRAYVGLQPSDLDDPIDNSDERFAGARHPDWRGRASRISTAMWKLKNMGIAERMNIGNVMQQRRLVDAVNSINEKLKTFEDKFEWLDGRLASVESQSIDRSNKH
jgi:hypothetical protein